MPNKSDDVTVATVYRTGGVYTPEYVEKLKRGFERHLPVPHKFVCLTDDVFADYCVPLQHDWPGWWAKIELFRPGVLTGRVIAVDLDTVLLGDLSALLAHDKPVVMLGDYNARKVPNSCLMYWGGDLTHIYTKFCEDPRKHRTRYDAFPKIGDQAFIADVLHESNMAPALWWDILPKDFLVHFQQQVLRGRPWRDRKLCWWSLGDKPHALRDHPLIKENWI